MKSRRHARSVGFTLIEVLVALAIVATALVAALRAVGQGTSSVETMRSRLLAGWVAENDLARRVTEKLFYQLLAPPKVLAGKFVPGIGLADTLEAASVPQQGDVEKAMRELATQQP